MPLLVSANRAADIRDALALAREERLKLILEGASEGWRVANEIARSEGSGSSTPVENTPASVRDAGRDADQRCAPLPPQGSPSRSRAMATTANARCATMRAMRPRAGSTWKAALAAITINPARIFGLADRIGSLEAGKEGDVVIWDGDPLDTLARARPRSSSAASRSR